MLHRTVSYQESHIRMSCLLLTGERFVEIKRLFAGEHAPPNAGQFVGHGRDRVIEA